MKKYKELIKVIDITDVTRKGQTTIPKEIRDYLGIKEGDKVIWAIRKKDKEEVITMSKVS